MRKRLRCITKLLTRARNLLGEDTKMVSKAEHILEDAHCLSEVFFVVRASLRKS
jgi:hypothetical protein